MFNLH